MGIVSLLDLGHGGWEHIETCPHTQHDTKAAATLAAHLSEDDLLLADRAFCSYEFIARCRKRRPKPYQLLTKHRSTFIEIQHRGRYRKVA